VAFPTIPTVAAGRVLTVNQLNTTATRTFPSLTGLTKNAGDLLIAIVVGYNTSTGTNAAFSGWTGGFTEFHDSATNGTLAIGMAYKWSTGSETGTFAVTQAATITGDASMILLSIEGAHATTPPEAGSRASGTTAAANPAAFNPAGWDVDDTLWISLVGSGMTSTTGSWTATGTTAPTNYTDRVDTNAADVAIGDVEAAVSFRQATTASEDVGTAGVDTSNARNAAVVIAIRPAGEALQPVYVTATARYIQKIQLVGPFSSVIRVAAATGTNVDGTLAVTAATSGDATRAVGVDGALPVTAALSADFATIISSTGTLAATAGLSADASVVAAPVEIDGSLAATAALTADVVSVVGVDGSLSVTVGLSADADVVPAIPGIDIDGTLAVTAATAGDATRTISTDGALAITAATTADVANVATADGSLAVTAGLTADAIVVGQVNVDGTLAVTAGLTADTTAVLAAGGDLAVTAGLSADAAVVPALLVDGALPITAGLTASIASVVGVEAVLAATVGLAATAEVIRLVTIDGALVVTVATTADTFSAAATVPRPPSGFVDRPLSTVVDRPFAGNVAR
jgi:hypothetical protein